MWARAKTTLRLRPAMVAAYATPLLVGLTLVTVLTLRPSPTQTHAVNFSDGGVNYGPENPPTRGDVWPRPYQEDKGDNYFRFDPLLFNFKISDKSCSRLTRAMGRSARALRQLSGIAEGARDRRGPLDTPLDREDKCSGTLGRLTVHLDQPCEKSPHFGMDESYSLNITSSSPEAVLRSSSIWGILRGLETFTQLFYLSDDYYEVRVITTAIVDKPRYLHRGLLIDTARHFISMETILKTLDAMAMNKMNVLHWHIVDDQSFPYQSEKYPELSEKGAYFPTMVYDKRDVQTVIKHASDHGIRVVPEFDVPGHTRSWGNAFPSVLTQCYSKEKPSGLGPMDPTNNATYKLLRNLFEEVRHVFPDDYLHLGGDEVDVSCWRSNPKIVEYLEENGMIGSELHALFMRNTMKVLDNSTKVIVWQEVFDEGVPLTPGTLVQIWKTVRAYQIKQVLTAGFQVLFSTSWYLEDPIDKHFPRLYTADPRRIVYNETGNATLVAGIVGGEACLWAELLDDGSLLSTAWPRASAVAEVLWSHDAGGPAAWPERLPPGTLNRAEEHICRMIRRGVPAKPLAAGFCPVS